jgi:hypothetical protein
MEGRVAGEGHKKNTTLQKKVLIKKQRLKKNTIFFWRLKGALKTLKRKKGPKQKKTQKKGMQKRALFLEAHEKKH